MKTYRIADRTVTIDLPAPMAVWDALSVCYAPFLAAPVANPDLAIQILDGGRPAGYDRLTFHDEAVEEGQISLGVFEGASKSILFELQEPFCDAPDGWLEWDDEHCRAQIYINLALPSRNSAPHQSALSSALMLAFMLMSFKHRTLMTHTSCVIHSGIAYLFQGKSGTGKSTHSRMWLENIPGTELLNDDHPAIALLPDGTVKAYGTPWSGKTPCYRNLSAPVGAIVRIKQAPENAIRRLSPIEAYASLSPSVFNTPFSRRLADVRHALLERIIASVPCYELGCLPDADAAALCCQTLTSTK